MVVDIEQPPVLETVNTMKNSFFPFKLATLVLPEDGVGSPVFLINRISFLVDGERGDPLDQGQGVNLVHAVQVGLGELVVLHVRKVVPEPGEERHQVVK